MKHESSLGYEDKAIIGGMAKMAEHWVPNAYNEKISPEVIEETKFLMNSYHGLSLEQRKNSIESLLHRILGPENEIIIPTQDLIKKTTKTVNQKPSEIKSLPRMNQNLRSARNQKEDINSLNPIQTKSNPQALLSPLTVIHGIGPKIAHNLAKLGLRTLEDLLYYFPRRYDDYSQLKPINKLWFGDEITVVGIVQSVSSRKARAGKLIIIEVIINDGTGSLRLNWFNQPWLENRFKHQDTISVSGKVEQYLGRLVINNPDWEPIEVENINSSRILPVYPLTSQVTQKYLRNIIRQVTTFWTSRLPDYMPTGILESANLPNLGTALSQVHFPDSQEQLKFARERLAFDEIFFLQLGVLRQKYQWQEAESRKFDVSSEWLDDRKAELPYLLTKAQERVIIDIRQDLASGRPMNRLLQGDVGSGKTIIAALTAMIINKSGSQAAILAPTSILAEQHYQNFSSLCTSMSQTHEKLSPEQIRLLIGDTPEIEKEEIRSGLDSGKIKIIIGTHALLEEPVRFKDLQLAVIDEQHRFGVEQRSILRSKGNNPHLLVMTATPIPRSLALTIYGDLDVSVMDELPPGRQVIDTYILFPRERERAYSLIQSQVEAGHQSFIVYPLVEEGEKSTLPSATQEFDRLQKEIFPTLKLGLIHGRLRPEEKENVMSKFRKQEFDILISTTVVEVGVDIPEATVMLIEAANRFGLAQLHQLRGRVGRGKSQSYCLLIPENDDSIENERLTAMVETNDGFLLAEKDLQQRGPGDFLGTRQAGYARLKMANLTDIGLIEKARKYALELFEIDADLSDPQNQNLEEAMGRFWAGGKGDIS